MLAIQYRYNLSDSFICIYNVQIIDLIYTQTLKVKNISLYNKSTDDPLAVLPMIITIVIIFIYCKVQGIIFLIFLTSGACASIWVKERGDSLKYTGLFFVR